MASVCSNTEREYLFYGQNANDVKDSLCLDAHD